jgi:hypothetical protein
VRGHLNNRDFARFAAAISVSTDRMNDLGARLPSLPGIAANAALQFSKLSATAARMVAAGQLISKGHQSLGLSTSDTHSFRLSDMERGKQAFFSSRAFAASVGVLAEVGRRIEAGDVPIAREEGATSGRLRTYLGELASVSTVLGEIANAVAKVFTAMGGLPARMSPSGIEAPAIVPTEVKYSMLQTWAPTTRAIRSSVISDRAIKPFGEFVSPVLDEPENDAEQSSFRAGHKPLHRSRWSRLRGIAPSMFDYIGENPTTIAPLTSSRLRNTSIPRISLRAAAFRGAASGMLAAPRLPTPAFASVSPAPAGIAMPGATSVVINSTPTIVINSCQAEDIEQRVLRVLRQHREAIYEQWCGELKRRQRTEF